MKPKHVITAMVIIVFILALPIIIPHPYQHICLYQYDTTIESEPKQKIRTYLIEKMPTVCVNVNDAGFARTTRTTIDEGYDTPEVRSRMEKKFKELVEEQRNK